MKKRFFMIVFTALLAFIAFLSFYRLDAKYVDPYDEARHGVNAYEMYAQGNLVESTYGYETDYYNLKPPLSMWCIMASFVLLGKSVFALRAYSAVCYIILAAAVGLFVKKHYGILESVFVMIFLSINTMPFEAHMIRAGDADSLYVLLFTLAMLCMMEIPKKQNRLYLCGLFFSLAFLCKSFHAGIIAVIGGLFLLLAGELKKISVKKMLIFLACAAAPIAIWSGMRFFVDGTAFFKQMLFVDVLGRTSGALHNNQQPFGWYLRFFMGAMSGKLTIYLWAAVICIIGFVALSHTLTKENYKEILAYVLWILIPFLAFSAVTNKLVWYMYPVTIPLLMCAGITVGRLLKAHETTQSVKYVLIFASALLFVYYAGGEIKMMRAQGGNEFQDFVTEVAKEYQDESYPAYLALKEEGKETQTGWGQQDVYLAEVYGDMRCQSGGVESFMQAEEGVLFVDRESTEELQKLFERHELQQNGKSVTLFEGKKYCVFVK